MARNYRPNRDSDDMGEGRKKSRRRHDFSHLRGEKSGAPWTLIVIGAVLLVAFGAGLVIYQRRPAEQSGRTVWASEGHGDRFEAIVEETAQTLYAQWRRERGSMSAGEESALLTEARAKARRTCTFLVRSMKIGKELGASDEVREAVYQKLAPVAEDGGDVRDDQIRAVYAVLMGR